jgi:hypothetical protein
MITQSIYVPRIRREIMTSPENETVVITVTELNAILEKIREASKEVNQLRESIEISQQQVLGQNIVHISKDEDQQRETD